MEEVNPSPVTPPGEVNVAGATGDEVVTLSQFKVFTDSLVDSGGGGGNEGSAGGFANFIPVDDIGIEKIAERIVGQENPAILCIRNNDTGDLLVVHIPGVNNSEIYIGEYETDIFLDAGYSAVNISAANNVDGNAGVQILDRDAGYVIYHLVLDQDPENTFEEKDNWFDTYCTVFIMFLDGYYS